MSVFEGLFEQIKNTNDYREKARIAMYMVQLIENNRKKLKSDAIEPLKSFALDEISKIAAKIENADGYRQKSCIFEYNEALIGIIINVFSSPAQLPPEKKMEIDNTVNMIERYRYIENTVNRMFEQESIEENEAEHLIDMVSKLTDEYQRGLLYAGLIYYSSSLNKLTSSAKNVLSDYINGEFENYLKKGELTEDETNNLEEVCDVCKHFSSSATASFLIDSMKLGNDKINYFALDSLLSVGGNVPVEVVDSLAKNPRYANLTYKVLEKHSALGMFPTELNNPVYLAQSDLTYWLTYPTELGKEPDEIEYIGCGKVKKEQFYIFKYRSDSQTLSDELKGNWLIGWSSDDGGTFSNFDLYSKYEKKTPEKTVKHIIKKLIK